MHTLQQRKLQAKMNSCVNSSRHFYGSYNSNLAHSLPEDRKKKSTPQLILWEQHNLDIAMSRTNREEKLKSHSLSWIEMWNAINKILAYMCEGGLASAWECTFSAGVHVCSESMVGCTIRKTVKAGPGALLSDPCISILSISPRRGWSRNVK